MCIRDRFWVDHLVHVAIGRSSWWKNCACDRHDFFSGATTGVRCAMVCIRGRGCCPGRHPLRFTIYRLVWDRRQCPNGDGLPRGRWPSGNMPCKLDKVPHFKSIRFDLLPKKSFGTSFSNRSNRLAISFSSPNLQMPCW